MIFPKIFDYLPESYSPEKKPEEFYQKIDKSYLFAVIAWQYPGLLTSLYRLGENRSKKKTEYVDKDVVVQDNLILQLLRRAAEEDIQSGRKNKSSAYRQTGKYGSKRPKEDSRVDSGNQTPVREEGEEEDDVPKQLRKEYCKSALKKVWEGRLL